MSLNGLPVEVILEIVRHLESCRDMNAFLRVNRGLHSLLDDELYVKNIKQQNSVALIWAAERGRPNTVRRFLALGANPNAQLNTPFGGRRTALHGAARKGHFRIVQILLDYGADPRVEDASTKTPLCEALCAGHERVARQLARHTKDFPSFIAIRNMFLSPVHVAARLHKYNSIRWLVDAGQDINQANSQGKTALHFVLSSGMTGDDTLRVAMALVDMGATFGCGPHCMPDEAATRARNSRLASPEPLVRCFFERISCRCGIETMEKFVEKRETSKSYKGWYNVDTVAKTRMALLGHAI